MPGIEAYKQNSITTQTPGSLIVLLYQGAVKFLKQAISELEAGDVAAKGESIGRAKDIIHELNISLDMDAGGEVSQNLRALYHFMSGHLTQANTHADAKMIREVIDLLEDLNEGWQAAAGVPGKKSDSLLPG